jgi:hypothetical protein
MSIEEIEVWKDIEGYKIYEVSSFGNVRNKNTGRILKACNKSGYFSVGLSNIKTKSFEVHRLVAKAFIPNLENKPEVNHKDGDKLNNNYWNLEWATHSENMTHARNTGLITTEYTSSKPISQFTIDGQWIKDWASITEVHRENGFDISAISNCINSKTKTLCGKTRTSYGFIWKFKQANNA